jgi:HK97 family phage major capsid protein
MKRISFLLHVIAAVTLVSAYNLLRLGGVSTLPLYLCFDREEIDGQLLKSMDQIQGRFKKMDGIEKSVEANAKSTAELQSQMLELRKHQLGRRSTTPGRSPDVSDACARFFANVLLAAGFRQGKVGPEAGSNAELQLRNDLGIHEKSALTSSDIPLPIMYAGEVSELVHEYGVARKIGTVFPLGSGVVKLPRLKTDPAFGLLAQSGTVTEVSPQTEWVTLTPEKFGGLIRLPSEIEEDSIVEMGRFVARYAARQIAAAEDYQFFLSTGAGSGLNGTAKGLTKAVVDEGIVINQASTKTKQSDMTLQNLRDLRSASGLHAAVLSRARYMCHPSYEAAFTAFNTAAAITPYQRGLGMNGATLDGFPITWVPSMPAYSTTASASLAHVLFGDPSFMYLGVRGSVRLDTSRDAAFATDEILIRALERLTVGKMALACVAALVTAAS